MVIQSNLYLNNLGLPLSGSQDFVGLARSRFNTSQQHQHQQQQNMFVDNNFNTSQQHQQNMFVDNNFNTSQQHQHQQQQNMFFGNNSNLLFSSSSNSSSSSSMAVSQALALQFQRQSWEIDQYLRLQNEKLRLMVEEQRKQQVATLLKIAESKGVQLLRQKEEEITQAMKKKMELEQFITRMEQENEAWKKVAQEKEAMVLSLHNTIEKLKERRRRAMEDAGSCCNEKKEEEEEKIVGFDDDEVEVEQSLMRKKKKMKISSEMGLCKRCDFGKACVLFLPCRHLCSCKDCEVLLQDCPLCGMPKKASMEALIF